MLENIFLTINTWMTGSFALAAIGCFLWGMISILFSPCHMASIPLIIAYVGGQERLITGKKALKYALLFTGGLFLTIFFVGLICTALGRILGDVGPWWSIGVGLILIYAGFDMLGIAPFSLPGCKFKNFTLKGYLGAFGLGLTYGILSGSCTFSFLAPILAIISIQEKTAAGIFLLSLFAFGHSLPIIAAGSSTAIVGRLLAATSFQNATRLIRRASGCIIIGLGGFFIIRAFGQ